MFGRIQDLFVDVKTASKLLSFCSGLCADVSYLFVHLNAVTVYIVTTTVTVYDLLFFFC